MKKLVKFARNIVNWMINYWMWTFHRKQCEEDIEWAVKTVVNSFFKEINKIPFFDPRLGI